MSPYANCESKTYLQVTASYSTELKVPLEFLSILCSEDFMRVSIEEGSEPETEIERLEREFNPAFSSNYRIF
jgi:hypothetical protein